MRAIWMRDRDRESDGADMPDATKDYSMAAKATPRTSMKYEIFERHVMVCTIECVASACQLRSFRRAAVRRRDFGGRLEDLAGK